ncbi:MAG: hypothetical protein LBK60_09080, partial [Verrucomicrobiales bacterium]|nr:hypothetical protein [Verrucomicrobiales bacterium]
DARRNTQKFRAGQAVEVADGTAEPVESELLGDMHAGRNRRDVVEPQDEVSKSQRDLLNKLTEHKRAHADVDEEVLATA